MLPTSATPKQLICPEKQGLTQSITETGRVDSNTQHLNSAITCQQPKPLQQPRHCLTRLIPRPAAWERRAGRQEKTREESVNFIYFLREQKAKEEGLEKEHRQAGHCVMGCTFAQSTRSKIKSIQGSRRRWVLSTSLSPKPGKRLVEEISHPRGGGTSRTQHLCPPLSSQRIQSLQDAQAGCVPNVTRYKGLLIPSPHPAYH